MEEYKQLTIDSYNKNAKLFSEKFKSLMDLRERYEFTEFINLLSGKEILDLGCGAGDHSEYFAKRGLSVTAVDLSEEMIHLCKKKNLNAFVMDIEDLKFPKDTFDGIWSVTSLLHVPRSKLPIVISKLHDILKNKGILYVCLKKGEGEKIIEEPDIDSKRFFSFWQMEDLLKQFESKFELITSEERLTGKTTFLSVFFRKK